ncbi:putative B3 domain-containing protein [Tanacetum coccineum]
MNGGNEEISDITGEAKEIVGDQWEEASTKEYSVDLSKTLEKLQESHMCELKTQWEREEVRWMVKFDGSVHELTILKARIPPAFMKYFGGYLPLKFILMTSSGKSWKVDVNKIDNYEIEAANNKSEKEPIYILEDEANTTGKLAETNEVKKMSVEDCNLSFDEEKKASVEDCNLSFDEEKKASVENWNLSFEVTIQQRNMTKGYILVPKVFYDGVKDYRPLAKLQHMGRTWDVSVIKYGDRVQFTDGWNLLALENCLAVGDGDIVMLNTTPCTGVEFILK